MEEQEEMEGFISTAQIAEKMRKKESTIKRYCRDFGLPYFPNRKGGYWVRPDAIKKISENLVVPADVREARRAKQEKARKARKEKKIDAAKSALRSEMGRKAALKRHAKNKKQTKPSATSTSAAPAS